MPVLAEPLNLGDLLKYEAPNLYSRDQLTIAAGQNLVLGAIVGIDTLTEKVKAAFIENGESVKGASLHAVYSKGRVSWELEGLMMIIPQLKDARKEGDPSVTIRRI